MALGSEVGRVVYAISGDNSQFEGDVKQTQSIAESAAGKIAGAIGVAFAAAVAAGAAALGKLAKTGIEYNAQMEQYSTAFTTLMSGNAEAANGLIDSIRDLAASTPLAMDSLAAGAQTLMGYGMAGDQVIPTLQMLGDVAMGDADKLNALTLAYSQVLASGKLMGQDALQMINAGVPIYALLGEQMGITAGEAKKLGEEGKISAEMVTEALKAATSEGGMFFGAMEAQSQTLTGKISTLKDNFNQFAGELAESLMPVAMEYVDTLDGMISGNDELKGTLTTLFTAVAQLASAALPMLVNMLGLVIPLFADLMDGILPVLVEMFNALMPPLMEIAQALLPPIIDIINALLPPLLEIAEAVMPIVVDVLNTLMPILADIAGVWGEWIGELLPPLIGFLGEMIGPVMELAEQLFPAWKEIMDALLPVISSLIGSALEPLLGVFSAIIGPLSELLLAIMPPLLEVFNALTPILISVFDAIGPIIELVGVLIGLFMDGFIPVITEVSKLLLDALGGAFTAMQPYIETLMDILGGLITFLIDVFKGDWEGAWEAIKDVFLNIIQLIPQGIETMVNSAIAILNSLIATINSVLELIGMATISEIGTVDFTPWNDAPAAGSGGGGGTYNPGTPSAGIPLVAEAYAEGLPYVPYDNFPGWMHKGERILTAADNVKFNALGGLQGMDLALSGISGGSQAPIQLSVNVTGAVEMDGHTVGRLVFEHMDDVLANM